MVLFWNFVEIVELMALSWIFVEIVELIEIIEIEIVTFSNFFGKFCLYYMSRDHPMAHELTYHIRHPSPAPWERSHFAKGISREVVRNSSCVSEGHFWQLAKDVFDWENIKDRVLRVKLIYDSGAYRFQPF